MTIASQSGLHRSVRKRVGHDGPDRYAYERGESRHPSPIPNRRESNDQPSVFRTHFVPDLPVYVFVHHTTLTSQPKLNRFSGTENR